MQRITLKQVVTKCLASLQNKEGRLGHSAQFVDGEHCCAIGIALNAKSLRAVLEVDDLNRSGLPLLVQDRIITIQSEEGADLAFIQNIHDLWAYGDEILRGCWFDSDHQGVRSAFYEKNKGERITEEKFQELLEDFEKCLT